MIFERIKKTQSPLEVRFLEDCATVGLMVEPQFKVGPIHADFALPEHNVVIECDSKQYHSTEGELRNDSARNKIYEKYGYGIIRLQGSAIYRSGEEIALEIKKHIDSGQEFVAGRHYYFDIDEDYDV